MAYGQPLFQQQFLSPKQMIQHLGKHLIFEFWGCINLNSSKKIEQVLREAVKACGATLLGIDAHQFSPQGASGVAILAESHISIHTWPENKYAAIDIFTCGSKVDPYAVLPVFKKFFKPKQIEMIDLKRGTIV